MKNHCVGLRPALSLAEARVTQLATASFRDKLALKALLQDLCKRPLGKISATDPYAMSLYKVSIRGVLSRSLQEASWKDQQSAQGPFSWCRKRGTKVVWGSPEGGSSEGLPSGGFTASLLAPAGWQLRGCPCVVPSVPSPSDRW